MAQKNGNQDDKVERFIALDDDPSYDLAFFIFLPSIFLPSLPFFAFSVVESGCLFLVAAPLRRALRSSGI